jgi:DNA modification methylase
MSTETKLQRREDLTFKFNADAGRHGWLRLTPAYSVKIVNQLLSDVQTGRILDPFSGTGTTALCAGDSGLDAWALEINPFLVWLGRAKVRVYSERQIHSVRELVPAIESHFQQNDLDKASPPPIFNIDRWWGRNEQDFLCRLKSMIDRYTEELGAACDLPKVAFCRTLIRMSNAAFNHQSMSFKPEKARPRQLVLFKEQTPLEGFKADLRFVLESAGTNPLLEATIKEGDARSVSDSIKDEIDMVITSPPYPNRMSYIRELRPYMYWLGFLYEPRAAGELDWKAIGGTWGVATSRLTEWNQKQEANLPKSLKGSIEKVRRSGEKNGDVLANYLAKYFFDMSEHFQSLAKVVRPGGDIHYIVGNSSFYGTEIQTQAIFRELMNTAGFSSVRIDRLRKRNSKKALYEFNVSATR